MEEVPVTASVGVDEPERVTEFTLVGVIEPKASVIAGVVVDVATVPLIPLAVVTLTLVTLPPPSATKLMFVPSVCKFFPAFPAWLGNNALSAEFAVV